MTQISVDKNNLQILVESAKFGIGDLKNHLQRREVQLDELDGIEQELVEVIAIVERLSQKITRLQERMYHFKDSEQAELTNIVEETNLFEADFARSAEKAGYTFSQPTEPIALFTTRVVVPIHADNGNGVA